MGNSAGFDNRLPLGELVKAVENFETGLLEVLTSPNPVKALASVAAKAVVGIGKMELEQSAREDLQRENAPKRF